MFPNDNIPIEAWKEWGEKNIKWFTKLFYEIMRSKMLKERRKSIWIPIINNKSDVWSVQIIEGLNSWVIPWRLEQSDQVGIKTRDPCIKKLFWLYVEKIDQGSYILAIKTDGKISQKSRRPHMIVVDFGYANNSVHIEVLWTYPAQVRLPPPEYNCGLDKKWVLCGRP